jgi:hypothetical protein
MKMRLTDMRKLTTETNSWKLLLRAFQFVGISRHNRVPNINEDPQKDCVSGFCPSPGSLNSILLEFY